MQVMVSRLQGVQIFWILLQIAKRLDVPRTLKVLSTVRVVANFDLQGI